jgi:hypothetical protein
VQVQPRQELICTRLCRQLLMGIGKRWSVSCRTSILQWIKAAGIQSKYQGTLESCSSEIYCTDCVQSNWRVWNRTLVSHSRQHCPCRKERDITQKKVWIDERLLSLRADVHEMLSRETPNSHKKLMSSQSEDVAIFIYIRRSQLQGKLAMSSAVI